MRKSPSFDERLQRLEPIFAELENFSGKPNTVNSSFSFREFDGERVKLILRFYFSLSEMEKGSLKSEQHIQDLERKKKSIDALLQKDPPAFVAQALLEWRDEINLDLQLQQQRKATVSSNCPVLSNVITALGDYLFSVYALHAVFSSDADYYEHIRQILIEMTTPNCFICGRTHDVGPWRNIWKRDRHSPTGKARQRKLEEKYGIRNAETHPAQKAK